MVARRSGYLTDCISVASIHPLPRPRRLGDGMKSLAVVLIAATLAIDSGCAKQDWIDRTLVTVDVTGVWEGKQDFGPGGGGDRDIVIVLQQQGAKVTGEI